MDSGLVAVASRLNVLLQVVNRQCAGHLVQRGGEGAHALGAFDQALSLQLAQRAVDRHAADCKAAHQLAFGGHALARQPGAVRELLGQVGLDLLKRR